MVRQHLFGAPAVRRRTSAQSARVQKDIGAPHRVKERVRNAIDIHVSDLGDSALGIDLAIGHEMSKGGVAQRYAAVRKSVFRHPPAAGRTVHACQRSRLSTHSLVQPTG